VTKGVVQSGRDVGEQFRGEMEVALRPDQTLVAHVDRKDRKLGPQVNPLSVPGLQTVNGKGGAQVV
jgi:hypothetical protein